jgi:hypothetical protein
MPGLFFTGLDLAASIDPNISNQVSVDAAFGMVDQAGDPVAVPNEVQIYGKQVLGVTEFFARADDGTVSQLTPSAAPTAFVNGGNSFGGDAILGLNDAFDLLIQADAGAKYIDMPAGGTGDFTLEAEQDGFAFYFDNGNRNFFLPHTSDILLNADTDGWEFTGESGAKLFSMQAGNDVRINAGNDGFDFQGEGGAKVIQMQAGADADFNFGNEGWQMTGESGDKVFQMAATTDGEINVGNDGFTLSADGGNMTLVMDPIGGDLTIDNSNNDLILTANNNIQIDTGSQVFFLYPGGSDTYLSTGNEGFEIDADGGNKSLDVGGFGVNILIDAGSDGVEVYADSMNKWIQMPTGSDMDISAGLDGLQITVDSYNKTMNMPTAGSDISFNAGNDGFDFQGELGNKSILMPASADASFAFGNDGWEFTGESGNKIISMPAGNDGHLSTGSDGLDIQADGGSMQLYFDAGGGETTLQNNSGKLALMAANMSIVLDDGGTDDLEITNTLGGQFVQIDAVAGVVLKHNTNDRLSTKNGGVEIDAGGLLFNERADHGFTPAAGKGDVWVRSDSPNVLVFTDDAGTDWVLNTSGAGGTLDDAYDFGGAGAGRSIEVDSGAVRFYDSNTGATTEMLVLENTGAAAASSGAQITFKANRAVAGTTDYGHLLFDVYDDSQTAASGHFEIMLIGTGTERIAYEITLADLGGSNNGQHIFRDAQNQILMQLDDDDGVSFGKNLYFQEEFPSVQGGAPTGGKGKLWLRSDTPNVLIFTDDAGTDWVLNSSASPWQTTAGVANLVTATDTVTIGSALALAKLAVDGDADEVQLLVQAHSTQTSNLVVFEQSDGTDLWTWENGGDCVMQQDADFYPATDDEGEIGTTTNRFSHGWFRNLDTGDLRLSDGKNSWVIREGSDTLYLEHEESGKRFRMVLEEV